MIPKGRAVTDEQKRLILDRLYIAWCNMPALRLGQLIKNVFGDKDFFYVEDDDFIEEVESFGIDAEMRALENISIQDSLKFESED